MATVTRTTQPLIDTLLQMEDGAAAITADGAGSSDIDIGSTTARFRGDLVIDVSAIDIANSDEKYEILILGSDSATFASGVEILAQLTLGDEAALPGPSAVDQNTDVGRYVLPFRNEQNGRAYRYLRLYVDVTGTTPSITFKAWVIPDQGMGG